MPPTLDDRGDRGQYSWPRASHRKIAPNQGFRARNVDRLNKSSAPALERRQSVLDRRKRPEFRRRVDGRFYPQPGNRDPGQRFPIGFGRVAEYHDSARASRGAEARELLLDPYSSPE